MTTKETYEVWFSGGPGTGVYTKDYELVEWYVCFQGTQEKCQSYVREFDHSGANWKVLQEAK